LSDALAKFVRWVGVEEPFGEILEDAKGRTWEFCAEHAVFQLADGRRVMVKGAQWKIDLELGTPNDPFGRMVGLLYVDVGDAEPNQPVASIEFHTHPKPTGASDADMRLLELLGQTESVVFEINGEPEGTTFRPKQRKGL